MTLQIDFWGQMPDQIEPKALHDAHSYCCPKSIIEWGTNLIPDWISIYQYLGIMFLMALESACMPVPSEIVMPFAGFLVAQGDSGTSLLGVTIAGSLGCRIGSIAACFFGFHAGRPLILRYGKYILIREKHLVAAKEWFENWGDKATFKARLLPVIRTVMSLPAGTAKMNLACCINLGHPP